MRRIRQRVDRLLLALMVRARRRNDLVRAGSSYAGWSVLDGAHFTRRVPNRAEFICSHAGPLVFCAHKLYAHSHWHHPSDLTP